MLFASCIRSMGCCNPPHSRGAVDTDRSRSLTLDEIRERERERDASQANDWVITDTLYPRVYEHEPPTGPRRCTPTPSIAIYIAGAPGFCDGGLIVRRVTLIRVRIPTYTHAEFVLFQLGAVSIIPSLINFNYRVASRPASICISHWLRVFASTKARVSPPSNRNSLRKLP